MKSEPNLVQGNWVAYVCVPPDLERQSIKSASLRLVETSLKGQLLSESSPLKRQVLRLQSPASVRYLMPVKADFIAELNKTNLLEGAPKAKNRIVPLSKNERSANLCATYSLDFENKVFQDWLDKNSLRKHANESELSFAWRVYVFIRSNYRYRWTQSLDRRNSKVCLERATDCGGLSYLLSGVLRANSIPARPLIGRWARDCNQIENDSSYFNCHVKSEFYVGGVGWIPVDISEAVSNRHEDIKQFFGNDRGDFITMHVDPDLVLDSMFRGKVPVRSMPDFRIFTKAGKENKIARIVNWSVSELEVR